MREGMARRKHERVRKMANLGDYTPSCSEASRASLRPSICSDDRPMTKQDEKAASATMSETSISSASDRSAFDLVVIGTGLAGYGLARQYTKQAPEASVLLVTSDDGREYSKPLLSTGFTKGTDGAALTMFTAEQKAQDLGVTLWTMTRVDAIDTASKLIRIRGRDKPVGYGALVIATGASVIQPPLAGDGLSRVYSVNDLMDYDKFRQAIDQYEARRIAIIGAGLIGCEFTNDLLNGGFEIDVIDPLTHCLPTMLPEACGRAVQAGLESLGARFHFGPLVERVDLAKNGSHVLVSLSDGQQLEADLVVSAVGVRPRIDLAKAAGLRTNRGIVTDRYLRTSDPNVYALGDCAEVEGHVLVYVAPLIAGVRALARTLTGELTAVDYPAMPVAIKTPVCPTTVAPVPHGAEGEWAINADGLNVRAEFRNQQGELLGFAVTGKRMREKLALQKELPPLIVPDDVEV